MTLKRLKSKIVCRPPKEVLALLERKGPLQPAGSVLYSEGDTRNFHEMLFVIHENIRCQKRLSRNFEHLVNDMLRYYSQRFSGWYDLKDLSEQIELKIKKIDFSKKRKCLKDIESLMMSAGRINSWIDLQIPWFNVNEVIKKEKPRFEQKTGSLRSAVQK